ncbi:type VI secretion system baseplate subunit TssG [Spirosoma fluviale]|uniref:Type VI secretion, VasB, ImpH, VC_A0111 n=1 Tax=Spirosoma fluviale TaxID=1597977 RepID=A0A286G3K8_9BACT|nr:type VI secretion system baseplate subunit TssG [Spirosoma fluviale]SOD90078.1 Type VI secretion, VasB, ImpH, VC_A0111 [Spirosoma fluviale]
MTISNQSSTLQPYFLDLLDVDFKAEILAASLADQQVPPERIIINPTGLYNRAYSKDILEMGDWLLEGSAFIYNRIDTPREGLFDMLPQYLFFPPKDLAHLADTDQTLDTIRQDRDNERQARLFFLPFDAELNYLRTLAVQHENSVEHPDTARTLIDQFAEQWPIIKDMNRPQTGLFLQILPWMHQVRSNLVWLSQFLRVFFAVPVTVEGGRKSHQPTQAEDNLPTLANCRLGVDTVMGNRFDDGRNGIQIQIGPVPDAQVPLFLPHSQSIALLHNLVNYFLPVSIDFSVTVLTSSPKEQDAPDPTDVYLGYTSFL